MFKDTLRIIYSEYNIISNRLDFKVIDVIDFGDRFVQDNPKKEYYGGIHLKKEYLNWTLAKPEKEQAIKEYYKKLKEMDEFRIATQKLIFDEQSKMES